MDEVVKELNTFLCNLQKSCVVGLDGYSGIGKTTISNEIEKINPDVKVIHMDDYVVTANTKEKLEPQLKNNIKKLKLEWSSVDSKGFEVLIEDIKSNKDKVILVEGIFFSHPDVLPKTFDKLVFLDGEEKLADERRVIREKERWGDKYFPETHPDSFARLFKLAWQRYKGLYKPIENSDLVIKIK